MYSEETQSLSDVTYMMKESLDGATAGIKKVFLLQSLIISPSRTQHFTSVSLYLSCEDQSDSTGWRVRRNTDRWGLEDCSSSVWGSQTGSTCTIRSTMIWDTGVYWCESESGEKNHPVNITVHFDVILESPVHPVTEGDTLTLHCLYQHTTPPNLRADFYKDESLIQSQTTEMIISTVSKSHEGFYYCKHPERGESPKSWISVTVFHSESQISVLHILSSVLAVSPYLLVTVVLIFRCCRMRERLENWVGMSGMALNWFRSYLEEVIMIVQWVKGEEDVLGKDNDLPSEER
ncbi:uncharacterized protein LOC127160666 [Labeo rohita]|uniref:uncharacterized protein LOC127160666 n=1 Tax=Labeo rohita TaxID=84645 RepID=UPI0021E26058|nr:uncharacterized protein LOC127160666 [Labeo rohita]